MSLKRSQIAAAFLLGSLLTFPQACSTQKVDPAPPLPEVPEYAKVPHPAGFDRGDLDAIFLSPQAPPSEELAACDADYQKLLTLTQSVDERERGMRELALENPVRYHWCFYSKIRESQNYMEAEHFVEEKQKRLLDDYQFIVPLAKAFRVEFQDSRYLKWATYEYQRMSRWVFYRPLKLNAAGTAELLEGSVMQPFGLFRKEEAGPRPVLEKYGLREAKPLAVAPSAVPAPVPTPETSAAPVTAPAQAPAVEEEREPAATETLEAVAEPDAIPLEPTEPIEFETPSAPIDDTAIPVED